MKKKVRVKSLPKAQMGFNNIPSQGIKPYDIYPPLGSMPKAITPDMMGLNVPTQQQWEKQNGKLSMTGDFFKRKKDFGIPTYDPSIPGSRMSQDIRNQEQTLREGEVTSTTPPSILAAQDKSNYLKNFTDANSQNQKGNPYVGQAILAGTDIFRGLANQIDNRFAKRDLRDQFLSDNLAYAREEGQSGNRGDYNFNEFGFGPGFRPDDYIKGDYNKEAQMGGEMKRKVKITSLPQAGYGGSQNQNAVNQLYGNSAYMVNKFSGAEQEEQEPAYNQTLQPDPRSMSVLEAEKGETLIRKGTNSAIPEFFKIGGKRHSEGGTPLSGEKATPDSFIYSDTKAMKIKDPAILESFGFTAKKGGYTPAKISKKFDLNSKELREGLYSDSDPLRKKTAVMMADNYISNLGKLALVQESQKGFPQGVPQIAMPYMNKVGLDPAQFLPPSPEEGMMMARYGGIPKAQIGQSVNSNSSNQTLPDGKGFWKTGSFANTTPEQRAAFAKSSAFNPLDWSGRINYAFTGDPSDNFAMDPLNYLAFGRLIKPLQPEYLLKPLAKRLQPIQEGISQGISRVVNPVKNFYKNLDISSAVTAGLEAAPAVGILSAAAYRVLSPEQKVEYLKNASPEQANQIVEDTMSDPAGSQDTALLLEAARENPNIDVARIEPVTIKAKPKAKSEPQSSEISDAYLDSMINVKRQEMVNKKEYGGELEEYQTAGQVTDEKEYVEEITLPNGSKGKRITKGNTISIVDASGKVLKSQNETLKPYIDKGIITWDAGRGTYRVALTDGQMPAKDRYNLLEELTPVLNQYGYKNIVQSGAGKTKSPYGQFYAGFTPQDYEYKIVERNLGKEQADSLDEVGLRKAAYDIMGFKPNVDISNPNIYNDPKFFKEFKNAFYRYLPEKKFRADLGDDERFGFEHYDAIPKKPKKPNTETNREQLETNELEVSRTPRRPIGFYPQDVLNTAAAVGDLASINKYNPRMAQFVPEPMEPTFYDPNRELANNAELANIASANLAQFTGPQAFNTRFSDVQGKSLANAANVLGRYNNLNVGVANQFEQANKQINNEANFRNALMANDFYDKTVIANQQFDNSKRAARREAVDYVNAALENRFMTDQMNSLYPNFFVDPAALKTYYNPGRKITPGQQAKDLKQYFLEMGIDTTNPTVQAAMVRGIMGDIDIDERGNILGAQSAMSNRRKTKGS